MAAPAVRSSGLLFLMRAALQADQFDQIGRSFGQPFIKVARQPYQRFVSAVPLPNSSALSAALRRFAHATALREYLAETLP